MSTPTTSLVRVDASKVREIAETVRKHTVLRREQTRNNFISVVMRDWTKRLFYKRLSFEEAAHIVDTERGAFGFRIYPWENECREDFELSSRLLAAADLALDNELWLNLKEAEIVRGWMVEEESH